MELVRAGEREKSSLVRAIFHVRLLDLLVVCVGSTGFVLEVIFLFTNMILTHLL